MLALRPLARAVAVVVAVLVTRNASAQCPDGGAPPCRAAAAAPAQRPVAIDRNRVAVLPFRVTTADSLLGEGFAELLAQEFTGEGGPRAVEMSTLLRTWRRTGGSLRNALPQDTAMLVARNLGAGILCQGTIVGLGGRLSISASLVSSSTAQPIGAPARVAGPADSVESLLRQVAAALLGTGASERVLKSARLSKSPAALRGYFEGLALMRRGYLAPAARAFEASLTADSLFASALYRRWLIGQAYAGGGVIGTVAAERVRARIELLTQRERTVFEAFAGKGSPRTRMQAYLDRRRAAEELGDSPDAWFSVGDHVYHYGNAVVGPDSTISLARAFLSLAVGLDTQPVFLFHLSELAIRTRDTSLMRSLLGAYNSVEGEDRWVHQWVLAAALRDEPTLEALRRAGAPKDWGNQTLNTLGSASDSRIGIARFQDATRQLGTTGPRQEALDGLLRVAEVARGRWVAAGPRPVLIAHPVIGGTVGVSGDPLDSVTVAALESASPADSVTQIRRNCIQARLQLERGSTPSLDAASIRLTMRCRTILRAWDAFNRGTLSDSALAQLDTLATIGNFSNFLGFEHRLLARIYESRGDTARAVRAIQLHPYDYGGAWTAPTDRESGRYFLMARDTARAIQAYERYLELRVDAQPPLVAERDSVKAILNRLTTKATP